jgi:enediyne polyketide synthase
MACQYPEAQSPQQLWENALAQRRAFRRMPAERMRLDDYLSEDGLTPDGTYATEAAVIEGYEFDRLGCRVAGSTYRAVDLAHWLALDVARRAVADAGFPDGRGLPREATGVVVGNTLTGEFSRAAGLRLRWPYVRRVVGAALVGEGWSPEHSGAFLERLEAAYKAPFPPPGEETLAGGMSNTIAGRICNHLNLQGGGYTVDGACASSLLAVATACGALAAGDLDVALVGGVDLSLDPFELVGFARVGALARETMRVYDARSAGFWPGEGCGFVVLARPEVAAALRLRVYARIRGWGVSSDGSGGITRPEVHGQLLAVQRAYRRAGFGVGSVAYFEGHGTGTSVGDATELQALTRALREAPRPAGADVPPAAIGSIKANIGHTKAAAGVAGLIKATMAVCAQVLPPTTGCERPHPELAGPSPVLRVLAEGEPWPPERPLRAGVSAMGFGGINTHVVLEGSARRRRRALPRRDAALIASAQDCELFLLSGRDAAELHTRARRLASLAPGLSRADLADLAGYLEGTLADDQIKAAAVAAEPAELAEALETLQSWLAAGELPRLDAHRGLFLGAPNAAPRVGFLFPGQGSPVHLGGGALRRRFGAVRRLYDQVALPAAGDPGATDVAQPAIATASLAGLDVLGLLGVDAGVAVGHSLGELTALHWGGAIGRAALLRIAGARGRAMAALGGPAGAMASLKAAPGDVDALLPQSDDVCVIAGVNAPRQTVVSGTVAAVEATLARARGIGIAGTRLPVSHAFHSPLVAPAAEPLAALLAAEHFGAIRRSVVSTVTGRVLAAGQGVAELLVRQVTAPVRFQEAIAAAADAVDLWVEVGPGRVLSALVADQTSAPVVALEAGGPSLRGVLHAAGAAYALGAPVRHGALFAGRFRRPFDPDRRQRFFGNPCEQAPLPELAGAPVAGPGPSAGGRPAPVGPAAPAGRTPPDGASPLEVVRHLVAARAELPVATVKDQDRLLGDLHLNSITVVQLVAEAARHLGRRMPASPIDFADTTVARAAEALETFGPAGKPADGTPAGVDAWVRTYTVELVDRPLRASAGVPKPGGGDGWRVLGPPGHPLVEPLRRGLIAQGTGSGVVVCLPPEPDERHLGLLLEGARLTQAAAPAHCVLVQHGGGAGAFARSLHLEMSGGGACLVDVPVGQPRAVDWILSEVAAAAGTRRFVEAHYGADGRRRVPVLRLLPDAARAAATPLGPRDVLLVSGGGKGIASECALALARETGVRLALLGRSRPETDGDLAANLSRMREAGVTLHYVAADVADGAAVRAAVRGVEDGLGPVTALLHGAGVNVPQLLRSADEAAFRRTLAPKVQGARNLLAAVDAERLKLFISFGSIISRIGMAGEAHYALANEWLARLTERFQAEHPACRCLTAEWSIWADVGMGVRLGSVDALARAGVVAIPSDVGIATLRGLVARPPEATSVVVAGRFGEPPTLETERSDLPLLRFLEEPRVHYPGVELVVDAELSPETDPYLEDHVVAGERLLPAVMGLEAMAQCAVALDGGTDDLRLLTFESVQFNRPVVLPAGGRTVVRLAALVRQPGAIEVALRCDSTDFLVDHFRATCRLSRSDGQAAAPRPPGPGADPDGASGRPGPAGGAPRRLRVDPDLDLYGGLLFQSGRFQRLSAYRRLQAKECVAEIAAGSPADWFGPYLPSRLLLGDPGVRDAALHAIQACIPHARILPVGVDRLVLGFVPDGAGVAVGGRGPFLAHARERSRDGATFVFDLLVTTSDGAVAERWEGLRLRSVGAVPPREAWSEPLVCPYLERRIADLVPGSRVAVGLARGGAGDRQRCTDLALEQAAGVPVPLRRRPDGRPETAGHPTGGTGWPAVSASHAGRLTLAVTGRGPLGCDVEPVSARPAPLWGAMLGAERFALAEVIARHTGEGPDAAATRVWAAAECLKKAVMSPATPLVFASATADAWVVLRAGQRWIATYVASLKGEEAPLAVAVLTPGEEAWATPPAEAAPAVALHQPQRV